MCVHIHVTAGVHVVCMCVHVVHVTAGVHVV